MITTQDNRNQFFKFFIYFKYQEKCTLRYDGVIVIIIIDMGKGSKKLNYYINIISSKNVKLGFFNPKLRRIDNDLYKWLKTIFGKKNFLQVH